MSKVRIRRVSLFFLLKVMRYRTPRGRFLAKEDCQWIAVDNSAGEAWTEAFSKKRQAIRWLRGELGELRHITITEEK